MIPVKVILHHSATKDSGTASWQAIRKWHMGLIGSPDENKPDYNKYIRYPLTDIGYHWGVELINDRYEILMGRRPDTMGDHTFGQNRNSIGICVVGNYDIDPVSLSLKAELNKLLTWIIIEYSIPSSQIFGHCEFTINKSCPGKNLFDWLKTRREQ